MKGSKMSDWGQLLNWLHKEQKRCSKQALYEPASTYGSVLRYIKRELGYWLDAEDDDEEGGDK